MKVALAFVFNTLFNLAIGLLVARFIGPDQFGRFALALSVGVALQVAGFEWIRQTAIRFYSERSRQEQPEIRATLDASFAVAVLLLTCAGLAALFSGLDLKLSNELLGLALAAAISNGLFDYQQALVRARFDDRLYARLILTKNLLSLVLTVGGAWYFGSAVVALIGICASMAGSVLSARSALSDAAATPQLARRSLALGYLFYAKPIVGATLLYLLISLVNRALITDRYGFAETGYFSLAYDLGQRIVASLGTGLDVLLFQMAVRADELHGPDEGRLQVARNMGIVLTLLMPACAGVWLILPSLEQLLIPADYRGPFEQYFSLLSIGLFASGMINFAINPVFQIAKRTAPLVAAAAIACLCDVGLIAVLPASAASLAVAQSAAMVGGLFALIALAGFSRANWPRPRELLLPPLGTGLMIAIGLPLRGWQAGISTMTVQIVAGILIYGLVIAVFDVAGLRSFAMDFARKREQAA